MSITSTRLLLYIIIILAVVLYSQSYFKTKDDYTIVQSYLEKINIDTLHDKHPIVIYDMIKDPKTLLNSLFAYSYISANYRMSKHEHIYQTKSKYTLIYNDTSDMLVNIISPKYKSKLVLGKRLAEQDPDVQYITIKLKQNQVAILPIMWYYMCDKTCKTITLDDAMSAVYNFIHR
jgi:hypothetical protein